MTVYQLDIYLAEGKQETIRLESKDVMFSSHSPFPVPNVGETLIAERKIWTVEKREFYYPDANEEHVIKIILFVKEQK